MGYDPIRDAVQSPMERINHSSTWPSRKDSADGRRDSNGRPGYPPAFQDHSPPGFSGKSTADDLRSILLNDNVDPRRPIQNGRASSFDDQASFGGPSQAYSIPSHGRTSIHGLLNSTPLAPPISHSSSASSHRTSSPSNNSPAITRPRDHPSLTPATPMSVNPRFQSPYTSVSPASAYTGLPDPQFVVPDQPGPSRRSMTMDPYPHPRGIPYSQLYRSPSASESPRGIPQGLPGQYSRPGSSSSQQFQPPQQYESPQRTARVLSDDFSRSSVSSRKSSIPVTAPATYSPSRPPMSVPRSPTPPRAIPYNPRRVTQPTTVLQPITSDELSNLRAQAYQNNPLRRKKRRAPPSWSGPSPSGRTPDERDGGSYFPPQDNQRRRSSSHLSARPSVTPGPGLPPAFEEATTPLERNGKGSLKRPSDAVDEEHDTARRKVSEIQHVGNAAHVASHYNARPDTGVQSRELSPIIGLKKFNNWIKSVMIGLFAYRPGPGTRGPGANVLDIGCGKGGDLGKWKQARIQLYVGMDLADISIEQADGRYKNMYRPGFDAFFFVHDCYSKSIKDGLPEHLAQTIYDNVTMQFCMHYAFESASKARMMIENVSRYLKPGGKYIGTAPDSELLLQKLSEIPEGEDLRFGNNCYAVQFEERRHKGIYGHSYHFYLEDAVNVPEYIVKWDNFVSLASEYKLKLIYKKSFHEILQEEKDSRDFGPLLSKMGVINPDGTSQMDEDQWEAANLYMAFAFEKY